MDMIVYTDMTGWQMLGFVIDVYVHPGTFLGFISLKDLPDTVPVCLFTRSIFTGNCYVLCTSYSFTRGGGSIWSPLAVDPHKHWAMVVGKRTLASSGWGKECFSRGVPKFSKVPLSACGLIWFVRGAHKHPTYSGLTGFCIFLHDCPILPKQQLTVPL